jgi:hypothetical protein
MNLLLVLVLFAATASANTLAAMPGANNAVSADLYATLDLM